MAMDVYQSNSTSEREPGRYAPVPTAVIGLGYWGPNLVRNLQECGNSELVAVCDKRPDALQKIGRRFRGVQLTTELSDVLESDEIEAVAIATPVATHYPIAAAALRAGKHVFVEKPLAFSTAEALDLARLARENGRVLMPGHTFLYSPPVNWVRDLLQAGQLGEIYFISMSRVNLGLHQSDASVAWDLGPHDFSILLHWLKDTPRYVSAASRGCIMPSIADVAFITLEFASGIMAHVELSWLAPSKLRRTTIVGSEKMLVYDDTSNEPVRLFDAGVVMRDPESFGEYKLSYRSGDIVSPHLEAAEPLLLEMADFCDAIRRGQSPRSSLELGIEVVRMIEAVDRSLAAGGARVELPAVAAEPTTLVA
ncbi:MAG: Gfo/Idh/MocA family oxidoreductase [Actinomycetota bacterium]|nr:Gfo/Idh/MocA family oxidoreductase [Actinomycetota bacterium]